MGTCIVDYLIHLGIKPNGMILSVEWEKAFNPARIDNIKVGINLSKINTKNKQQAIIKAAKHCLVHNTIQ